MNISNKNIIGTVQKQYCFNYNTEVVENYFKLGQQLSESEEKTTPCAAFTGPQNMAGKANISTKISTHPTHKSPLSVT